MSRARNTSTTRSRLSVIAGCFGVAMAMSIVPAPMSAATDAAPTGSSAATAASTPAVGATTAVSAGAATGPQLRISVDNGRTSAVVGDSLNYTVTIANLGSTDASGLQITQSVPNGLTFKSADAGGKVESGNVHWAIDLKATKTAVIHTTMTVSTTPTDLLRLATVACASKSVKDPPIVCASHSDQLPAGKAAALAQASAPTSTNIWWWYAGGGVVLILLIGAVIVLVGRRRKSAQ